MATEIAVRGQHAATVDKKSFDPSRQIFATHTILSGLADRDDFSKTNALTIDESSFDPVIVYCVPMYHM